MNEKIAEKVSVISSYSRDNDRFIPYRIRWRQRDYFVKKLAYYHRVRNGRTPYHIFHVTDGNFDFRLRFNGDDLSWLLEEVSDGYTD